MKQETGWRTPPQLRFGGDFTVSATFAIKKLPKPAQEDGAAIGLAIAFGDINQPEVTLVRVIEPTGPDVYRSIEKATANPGQMPDQMGMPGHGGDGDGTAGRQARQAAAPDFPRGGRRRSAWRSSAKGAQSGFRSSMPSRHGRGISVRSTLGPNDVAAVKLFASNRNGAEAVNVLLRDFTIHAGHINGLGTIVRTVFDEVIYSDPTVDRKRRLDRRRPTQDSPWRDAEAQGRESREPGLDSSRGRSRCFRAGARSRSRCRGGGPGGCRRRAWRLACRAAAVAPAQAPGTAVAPYSRRVRPPTAPLATQQPAQPPKPKAKIPFDEVESIRFERTLALSARFVGQPNLDFTTARFERQEGGRGSRRAEAAKPGAAPPRPAPKRAQ